MTNDEEIIAAIGYAQMQRLAGKVAEDSGWTRDLNTGEPLKPHFPTTAALIHSEVSEAFEAHRKNLMSDKLEDTHGTYEELADVVIRVMDYCHRVNVDLADVIIRKMRYNKTREDHKPENRRKAGGKTI